MPDKRWRKYWGGVATGVLKIALQTNGQMIVGGVLTNINGTPLTNIARINTNGAVDSTFKASVVGSYVYSVVLQSDGKVLVTGLFTNLNGVGSTNLARLNSDGTLDNAFQGYVGTTNPNTNSVVSVFVESSGKLLLSGSFTNINGVARYHLARLNSDGSLDADVWNGGSGDDDDPRLGVSGVTAIGQGDGKVFMFGNFSHINGVARRGLARLNVDGSVDDTFQNGMIGNPSQGFSSGFVVDAVIQADGKILLVGAIVGMNGVQENGIVRLWGNQPPCVESTSVQGDGSINITVRATPGVTNRLQFKNSLVDSSWTDLPVDIVGTDPSTTTNVVETPNGSGQRFYQLRQVP